MTVIVIYFFIHSFIRIWDRVDHVFISNTETRCFVPDLATSSFLSATYMITVRHYRFLKLLSGKTSPCSERPSLGTEDGVPGQRQNKTTPPRSFDSTAELLFKSYRTFPPLL